ncbi:hypothetical protein C8J56DRAFT_778795 [Mycena floridula]|nr:hypothetical protein C8J56DRAFT_778795 [Mycena floridula]
MSRFSQYKAALSSLSTRTGVPLPSLLFSFAVLHEVTAIVPLVGVFYGARTLGVGERVVASVMEQDPDSEPGWVQSQCLVWVEEGSQRVQRLGRKYGLFGFEKGNVDQKSALLPVNIAGDVANAVFAYGMTKALLPVRVGVSLYLSPAFARRIVEPFRKSVSALIKK